MPPASAPAPTPTHNADDLLTCCTMPATVSIGIANPTPLLAPLGDAIAVLMPTRRPLASSSGPPLLPGLMASGLGCLGWAGGRRGRSPCEWGGGSVLCGTAPRSCTQAAASRQRKAQVRAAAHPYLSPRPLPPIQSQRTASVWMTFVIGAPQPPARVTAVGSSRPSPDTMPADMDTSSPNGLPIAKTRWPTNKSELQPRRTGRRRGLGGGGGGGGGAAAPPPAAPALAAAAAAGADLGAAGGSDDGGGGGGGGEEGKSRRRSTATSFSRSRPTT